MNATIIANKINNMLLPVPERKEWKERMLSYSVYCIVSCSAVANRRARSSFTDQAFGGDVVIFQKARRKVLRS